MEPRERLTPADEAHLTFLRKQVDRLSDLSFRVNAPNDVKNQLFQAREELRRFVDGKSMQRYNI